MINLLIEAGRVVSQDTTVLLTLLACMLWGSVVITGVVRALQADEVDAAEQVSLAMGGWVVAVLLLAIPIFLVGVLLGRRPDLWTASLIIIVSAVSAFLVFNMGSRPHDFLAASFLGLLGVLVLSAGLRLAFAANTILPLYFDSAEHYRIASALAGQYANSPAAHGMTLPTATYYHYGFHLIIALLSVIPAQDTAPLILISGQLVLATLPACLYFIVRRETSSTAAAFMAVVLGMIGWYMPAHAVNWGKYPALFSLPAVLFCLDAGYLASQAEGWRRRGLSIVAGGALVAAFLIQTRSVILVGVAAAAWWLAGHWVYRPVLQRRLGLVLIILILGAEIAVIAATPTLAPGLDPYVGSGLSVTVFVGLLAIPGLRKYPRLALASLCSLMLLLLGLFLPVPGFSLTPLLDRPLVEMVLFVPLAILGACGIAGVRDYFATIAPPLRATGALVVCLAIAAHGLINYDFHPSGCCMLVHADDLVALDWIGKNLPSDSTVAIATVDLADAPPPYPTLSAGTDGGIWITSLTGLRTASLPSTTDFGKATTRGQLCGAGISDIYASTSSPGFNRSYLDARPDWYGPELLLPGVRIYHVLGCVE